MDAVTRESRARIAGKYDVGLENELKSWVQQRTGEAIHGNFMQGLKNGVVLCKLVNVKHNKPGMAFMERENIEKFNQKCRQLGLNDSDLFVTQDLYEGDNPTQVLQNLDALRAKMGGGRARGKSGYQGRSHQVRETAKFNSSARVYDASAADRSRPGGSFGLRNKFEGKPANNNVVKSSPPPFRGGAASGGPPPFRGGAGAARSPSGGGGGGGAGRKFCGECGAKGNGGKFCQECGIKL